MRLTHHVATLPDPLAAFHNYANSCRSTRTPCRENESPSASRPATRPLRLRGGAPPPLTSLPTSPAAHMTDDDDEGAIFRDMSFTDIMEELHARFLVNLGQEERGMIRLYWAAEQASAHSFLGSRS